MPSSGTVCPELNRLAIEVNGTEYGDYNKIRACTALNVRAITDFKLVDEREEDFDEGDMNALLSGLKFKEAFKLYGYAI